MKFGEYLIKNKAIDQQALDQALATQKKYTVAKLLGEILINQGELDAKSLMLHLVRFLDENSERTESVKQWVTQEEIDLLLKSR